MRRIVTFVIEGNGFTARGRGEVVDVDDYEIGRRQPPQDQLAISVRAVEWIIPPPAVVMGEFVSESVIGAVGSTTLVFPHEIVDEHEVPADGQPPLFGGDA